MLSFVFFLYVLLCTCRFQNCQRPDWIHEFRAVVRGPGEAWTKKIYKHRLLGHVRRTNRKHGFIVLHRQKPCLNARPARLPDASAGTVFGNNVFQTTDVHVRSGRKSNSNRWRQRQFVFLFLFLLVLFVRFSPTDQFLHSHTVGCYIVSSATPNAVVVSVGSISFFQEAAADLETNIDRCRDLMCFCYKNVEKICSKRNDLYSFAKKKKC